MIVRFSDWTPDASDLGSVGNVDAKNVLPSSDGYHPMPSLSVITAATTGRPLGAIEAFDKDNTSYQYVGDATKLYELNENDLTWTDVTNTGGAYTTTSGEVWNFVRWENKVLAVNWDDSPQQITFGGANFSNLTTAFKARNITVIGDFVVASNTYDVTDGNVPNRVRWSAIGDETDWTVSASTLSDFRDLTTGGPIRKIVGGEVGIIISDRSVFRMTFVGAPTVFQIDEILPDIGTPYPNSVASIGDNVYFVSQQGFVELTGNGTGVNRIGAGKVDRTFLDDLDPDYKDRLNAIADPISNRIFWAYPGSGNTSGRCNKIICYDRTFQRWSLIEEETNLLLQAKGVPITLDELDSLGFTNIDTMTVSFDSDTFKQTASQLAAFDEDFKLGFFRGFNKTATLTTPEWSLNPGYRTALKAFRPLVDGGTVTAEIGIRDRQSDSVTFKSSVSQSSTGRFTQRASAVYHRFRLTITGESWTDAIGIQIDPEDMPRVGRRA